MVDEWINVADSVEISDGSAIEVVVQGSILAVFRDGGELLQLMACARTRVDRLPKVTLQTDASLVHGTVGSTN